MDTTIREPGWDGAVIGYLDGACCVHDSDGRTIGRVESNRMVFDNGATTYGRVDEEGVVYDAFGFTGTPVGRVERDGTVYDSDRGGSEVGRAEGPDVLFAGAALLLLLRP